MKIKKNRSQLTRFGIILLSYLLIILVGGFLLWLPISGNGENKLSFVDALFTSTSSVCVTGLVPVNNIAINLSIFGKVVLAILIEIGGLGIVSLVMFIAVIFGFKITFSQRSLLKEEMNQNNYGGIISVLKKIIITAFIIQSVGAILNFISLFFLEGYTFLESIGYGIFHSISSFNNCGFDLFGGNSLIAFSDNILFNFSTCLMIFSGGIGFIVIFDVLQKRKIRKLSLHSKIVIITSLVLYLLSTLLYYFLNFGDITFMEAIFLSFTTRTAGFTTIDLGNTTTVLNDASIMLTMILMFIGAGPVSTAGGIKVTTLFAIFISFKSFLSKKNESNAFNRKINDSQINKAYILTFLSVAFVILMTFIIQIIEQDNFTFRQILFEVVSGFGTVGLTLSTTPALTIASKFLMMLVMYVGRLGPITIFSLFQKDKEDSSKDTVKYVEEDVIIG